MLSLPGVRSFVDQPLSNPSAHPSFGNFCHNEHSSLLRTRVLSMRVVPSGDPSETNRFTSEPGSHSRMSSLFRPWAEEGGEVKREAEGVTSLVPGDASDRESKYKSVKEHMKKRSEKYLLKKLKGRTGRGGGEVEKAEAVQPEVSLGGCPVWCPVEGYAPPWECAVPRGGVPMMGGLGPELMDVAASAQGLPCGFFEEYAKLLTEQQRMMSERSRKQRPKKFRCPHCHVGFSNNGQLKGHIRIHTGERPFKCDAESCGKSFTRNEELTRHRRIHSGLRPFPCSECGKRFGRKDHLKKHVKTHFQQRYQLVPILPTHCPYFYGL